MERPDAGGRAVIVESSPLLTLVPAVLAAFALLATGTVVSQAQQEPHSPTSPRPAGVPTRAN